MSGTVLYKAGERSYTIRQEITGYIFSAAAGREGCISYGGMEQGTE
jgi:hypothetical protein